MQGPHRNSSGANSEALLLLGSDTDCKAILFEALLDNTLKILIGINLQTDSSGITSGFHVKKH